MRRSAFNGILVFSPWLPSFASRSSNFRHSPFTACLSLCLSMSLSGCPSFSKCLSTQRSVCRKSVPRNILFIGIGPIIIYLQVRQICAGAEAWGQRGTVLSKILVEEDGDAYDPPNISEIFNKIYIFTVFSAVRTGFCVVCILCIVRKLKYDVRNCPLFRLFCSDIENTSMKLFKSTEA